MATRNPKEYALVKAMPPNSWYLAKIIWIGRAKIPRLVKMRNRRLTRRRCECPRCRAGEAHPHFA
jgi:hypothetical protein